MAQKSVKNAKKQGNLSRSEPGVPVHLIWILIAIWTDLKELYPPSQPTFPHYKPSTLKSGISLLFMAFFCTLFFENFTSVGAQERGHIDLWADFDVFEEISESYMRRKKEHWKWFEIQKDASKMTNFSQKSPP